MSVFERLESNVRSYCRAFPVTFDRATGAEIFGRDGTRYIDFLSGCGSLNYGHNNPVLKNALIDYVSQDGISLSLDMHTAAKERFLSALETHILRPRGLEYRVQFPGPTGANAVEAALKLARKATGRSNVIFFTNGFHGVTLGAVATTGNGYHRQGAALPLGGTTAMPYDGYFGHEIDTVAQLDRMIGDPSSGIDAPAAIIVECVQGEGGVTAARAEWLRGVEAVCRRHGALLIVDDIQAGCGRTGDFFSFEEAGLSPDIVTLSKSLSGFGLPFSLVLLKPEIDIWKPAEHNGTFRGNNLAFVTAAAMIETYWADGAFAETVRAKGELLGARLSAMAAAWPGAILGVRGRGMMRGLLCADAEAAGAIARTCFERGLIIERSGPHDEVVKCLAPLVIEDDVLAEGLDLLEDAVASVLGQPGHAIAAE